MLASRYNSGRHAWISITLPSLPVISPTQQQRCVNIIILSSSVPYGSVPEADFQNFLEAADVNLYPANVEYMVSC
jgi:hypothetical protein